MMRDDVVQLARDPGPLGRGRDLRLGVPFGFQPGCLVLKGGVVAAPVPHRVAEQPGEQDAAPQEQDGEDQPLLVPWLGANRHPHPIGQDRAAQARKQGDDRVPTRAVGSHGVQQHQERYVGRAWRRGCELDKPAERAERESCIGDAPPDGHGADDEQCRQHADPERVS